MLLLGPAGCSEEPTAASSSRSGGKPSQDGGSGGGRNKSDQEESPPVVEILEAIALLDDNQTYTGTTEPQQQVALRAQMTAQLLNLSVDIGDSVMEGQVVGQLDETLVKSAVQAAEADLATQQAEVAQARAELLELQAAIDEAKAEQAQAEVDAKRLRSLATEGAIAQQQAELAETGLRVAEQQLRSAQERFRAQEQAIAAAQQQVTAQRATLIQAEKQQTFATLTAPMTGVVLARSAEPGDLLQAGEEILNLGDLKDLRVVIQVTDQQRGEVTLGQAVQVQLDAFPNQILGGRISQISPVADPDSRLIPVEIALDTSTFNSPGSLGSGLLARVTLASENNSVIIPGTAMEVGDEQDHSSEVTLFVVEETGEGLTAIARSVQLGSVSNGQVEVFAGLLPGDRYVAKSDRPLQDGQIVRRSLASEF